MIVSLLGGGARRSPGCPPWWCLSSERGLVGLLGSCSVLAPELLIPLATSLGAGWCCGGGCGTHNCLERGKNVRGCQGGSKMGNGTLCLALFSRQDPPSATGRASRVSRFPPPRWLFEEEEPPPRLGPRRGFRLLRLESCVWCPSENREGAIPPPRLIPPSAAARPMPLARARSPGGPRRALPGPGARRCCARVPLRLLPAPSASDVAPAQLRRSPPARPPASAPRELRGRVCGAGGGRPAPWGRRRPRSSHPNPKSRFAQLRLGAGQSLSARTAEAPGTLRSRTCPCAGRGGSRVARSRLRIHLDRLRRSSALWTPPTRLGDCGLLLTAEPGVGGVKGGHPQGGGLRAATATAGLHRRENSQPATGSGPPGSLQPSQRLLTPPSRGQEVQEPTLCPQAPRGLARQALAPGALARWASVRTGVPNLLSTI